MEQSKIAFIEHAMEYVVLIGAVTMSVAYGIKRVYNIARSIEQILEHVKQDKVDRDILAKNLNEHIKMESDRDAIRDVQLIEITSDLKEITREVRPNGGSSMKDTINHIAAETADLKGRLLAVEQWKKDNNG